MIEQGLEFKNAKKIGVNLQNCKLIHLLNVSILQKSRWLVVGCFVFNGPFR